MPEDDMAPARVPATRRLPRPCRVIAVLVMLALSQGCLERSSGNPAAAAVIRANAIFETAMHCDLPVANPFRDAHLRGDFISPAGAHVAVDGFYDGAGDWRVRFVPRESGAWRYQLELDGPGFDEHASGRFDCAGSMGDGFLRLSQRNPFRMEYESGRPFYPIGVQTCHGIATIDSDGPNPDGSWRTVSVDEWCQAFSGAVNLVRVQLGTGTTAGCALDLISDRAHPDRYDLQNAAGLDRMYALHRAAGFSEMAILFQDMSAYNRDEHAFGSVVDLSDFKSLGAANLAQQEQYIRYVVARYGCSVDIWEIFNEDSYAPDDYLRHLYQVIRGADPYRHMITTNFSRPAADYCDLVVPHQYVAVPDFEVDALLARQIGVLKSYGKVVQYSEFGNKSTLSNDDPVKWRLAAWTAFMNESGMLFWSMSGRKTAPSLELPGNANAYLGPESRAHFRVLQDFSRDLPITMRPQAVESQSQQFRAYCLGDARTTVMYLHHVVDHEHPTSAESVRIQPGPGRYRVHWIDPRDGASLIADPAISGGSSQFLMVAVPPFTVDAACRIDRVDVLPVAIARPVLPAADPPSDRWRRSWLLGAAGQRDWFVLDGLVDAREGILQIAAAADSEGEALLHRPRFPGSVRVDFVGWIPSEHPCDLDVMLNAGAGGAGSGYLFQFGGKGNTMTRLLRAGKPMAGTERADLRLEPGRPYRVVVENDHGALRLRVDGVEVFSATDPEPLTGEGQDRIGFYTYGGTLCVCDLTVDVPKADAARP
ncbi:MAG: DUF5060 domain-containing protein [Planctomycetes bacterium]|nr:DUF5060 domain-containing protein [Planctomycetota bacterium]